VVRISCNIFLKSITNKKKKKKKEEKEKRKKKEEEEEEEGIFTSCIKGYCVVSTGTVGC
jgi:hypothetical protein